ncbi:MAG TPA: hypothetical protein VGS58_16340 [Candidatus Sulfopaludibacter sp.]|nr:hypothetical protein [Candidatus Sulfopaludibacter sp.]
MNTPPLPRWTAAAALLVLAHTTVLAGELTVMHCFAWTPVQEATPADWEAFAKASDALPKKIKGIIRVWYGKLETPLGQVQLGNIDNESFRKYQAGETVTSPISRTQRQYGMCMEMKNADVLKAYDGHPYHKVWTGAYAKVRVEGTTTFNILGQ